MLCWRLRRDTSRSGARWIDGDIPAAGVRRRCDTQVDRQNEGRTQEREIYARLDTTSPSCDCEVHFKLTRLIAASLTCVVLEGD